MYHGFFSLREPPFSLTPDTRYFFPGHAAQEALNVLLVALASGEGFVKIIGEVGTGKTMVCRQLLNILEPDFRVAYLPNPLLDPHGLYQALGLELGFHWQTAMGFQEYLLALTRHLADTSGQRAVLLVDEAQSLPTETLEALRLMTNLETESAKVLQVALFAQPELDRRLHTPHGRALRQRITFSHRLTPLTTGEVTAYIQHRLTVAGWRGSEVPFSGTALAELAKAGQGIPRLLNILAHKAMLAAYGEGSRQVMHRHLRQAIRDTDAAGPGLPFWRLYWVGLQNWRWRPPGLEAP